jgi:hypothetical protein
MITMMMFFTILNWYNAYCYIQFGMTPDEIDLEEVKKRTDERGLTPEEGKRMPKTDDELERARQLYSEKYESQEWWSEFEAAEPEKKKRMSREKVKADYEASGNYFID